MSIGPPRYATAGGRISCCAMHKDKRLLKITDNTVPLFDVANTLELNPIVTRRNFSLNPSDMSKIRYQPTAIMYQPRYI